MMSDYSDIVKQGYLKSKSKNLGHWKKKWVILRRASSKGPNRLERYTDEKASMLTSDCKVVNLGDIERVERIRAENRLYILVLWYTNSDMKRFAAGSDMEATEWHDVLLQHIGLRSPGIDNHGPSAARSTLAQTDPRDMFHVYLLPNTSTDYSGEYLLQITSESILLRDAVDHTVLVTWKLNTLRRYGRDDSKFTFESGRSSQTGEGLFIFTTVECERVYQKVHSATLAMVTVKNMTRRQKDGMLPEGTVLPVSTPLARHNSDNGSLANNSNGDLLHEPLNRDSKSLPPTPSRAPMPVPRSATNEPVADNNANTLYSEAVEDRRPLISQGSLASYGSRPLPPTPQPSAESDDPVDYVYEEKGLTENFRRFLQERKEDDLL